MTVNRRCIQIKMIVSFEYKKSTGISQFNKRSVLFHENMCLHSYHAQNQKYFLHNLRIRLFLLLVKHNCSLPSNCVSHFKDALFRKVNVGLSIPNLEPYSFESGAEISAGFKVKGIGASSTVRTSFYTSIYAALEKNLYQLTSNKTVLVVKVVYGSEI